MTIWSHPVAMGMPGLSLATAIVLKIQER